MPLPLLYHGAKKSKMTKNSNQGGPALKESQAVGTGNAMQIEGRELAPLNCLKRETKAESTRKLASKLKLDHYFMSKILKKEGPSVCACKENSTQS